MKYYAANEHVSTDPIDGGIEITEAQYQEALNGMTNGLILVIIDGVPVLQEPVQETEEPTNA